MILRAEEEVYRTVLAGELQIDKQGRIWRIAIRQGDRWHVGATRTTKIARRRAEHRVPFGYLQVRAMYAGKRHHACAHRLVWRHFKGSIPVGLTINHKNGIKDDNRLENLELATYHEQQIHALHVLKHGRTDQWGEKNAMAKLSKKQVREIIRRRAAGERLVPIARDMGVAMQTVSQIARRESRCRG